MRARSEDIPQLTKHTLGKLARQMELEKPNLAPATALGRYAFPGNVRELENCVQHMVAINTGPLLHVADLPSPIQNFLHAQSAARLSMAVGAGASNSVPAAAPPTANYSSAPPVIPLTEVEKRAILQALDYTKGDRGVAAGLLGIGRTTLYRKLKEYQMAS